MTARRSAAVYAPLKPPDHPAPSGDRLIARLFMQAFARIDVAPVLASRFRSRDAIGDPARQARMAALGPWLGRRAARRFATRPPDFWFTYHLYYKAADWFGPEAAAAWNIPYIVAEASHAPKRAGGPWDMSHRRVAAALGAAARVLCLNRNDMSCLAALVGEEKLVHFPPFLDAAPYRTCPARRAAARAGIAARHDLPADAVWLLAVGMMRPGDKARSYAALARALARLRTARPDQTHRDWRLLVVGDGPGRAAVEAELAAASGGRARFVGQMDAAGLRDVYAAADLMAWPAQGEAFGMAMLEAQASGLAVVAGDVGGVAGVVTDGQSGLLTPPGDDAAFAAALTTLIDDADRRHAFGAAGRDRVSATQSLEAAARRLETVLEDAGVR